MAEIIIRLNQTSDAWFSVLALNSLHLLILFILLLGISALLHKKSSIFLYSVWSLFLLKAVLLPVIRLPFLQRSVIPVIPLNTFVYNSSQVLATTTASFNVSMTIQSFLFLFWIAGIVTLLIMYIRNERLFYASLKQSKSFPEPSVLEKLAVQMEIKKPVDLRLSANIPAPFCRGLRKPVIFLPESASEWNKQQLNHVLCHELAHIKRNDILIITFQNIINVLYFFHPLVWMANHQINFQREKICDDTAIALLNENPVCYGRTLMDNLESFLVHRRMPLIANGLFFSKKTIIKRFEYLLNRGKEIKTQLGVIQKGFIYTVILLTIFLSCNSEFDNIIGKLGTYRIGEADINGFYKIPSEALVREIKNKNRSFVYKKYKIDDKIIPFPVPVEYITDGNENRIKISSSEVHPPFTLIQGDIVFTNKKYLRKLGDMDNVKDWRQRIKLVRKSVEFPESKFIPYDSPPEPTGGFKTIQENIKYPKEDEDAGNEGTVIVQAYINEDGNITSAVVQKSSGYEGLDIAGLWAVKKTKFKPAMQKEKPIGVYISIPVLFKSETKGKTDESYTPINYGPEFIPYDSAPEPVGGHAAIQKNVQQYNPRHVNGTTIIKTFISENGTATQLYIEQSCGSEHEDQIAWEAVKNTKFIPAQQRDKKIGVWIAIPVVFQK